MNIFVGNLSYGASKKDLKKLFEKYGEVISIRIPEHPNTGRPKGYGFVHINSDEEGRRAIEALNGTLFQGRKLTLEAANNRDAASENEHAETVEAVSPDPVAPGRSMPRILLGASAYMVICFPLAVLWHMVLFPAVYDRLGYFNGADPNYALGFLSIFLQGLVLSVGYDLFSGQCPSIKTALQFSGAAGLFLWTCHVAAFAAKHPLSSNVMFFAVETAYLVIQFTLFGLVLGLINGLRSDAAAHRHQP